MLFIRSLGSGLHLRCLTFPSMVPGIPTRWGRLKACSAGAGASGNAGDGQGSASPSGVAASSNPGDLLILQVWAPPGSANPFTVPLHPRHKGFPDQLH